MILHSLIQLSNENYGLSCQKKDDQQFTIVCLANVKTKGLFSLLSCGNSQDWKLCAIFFPNIEGIDFSV